MTITAWVFSIFTVLFLPMGIGLLLFRHRLDARIERVRILQEQQMSEAGVEWSSEYIPEAGTASSATVGMIFLVIGLICLLIFVSEYF